MSLFDFEIPHVQGVVFDPAKQISGLGSSAPAAGLLAGAQWFDASGSMQSVHPMGQAGLVVAPAIQSLAAIVTNTNPTSATNLMTQAFLPGSLNTLARTVYLYAAGQMTTGTGTTTTVAVTLNDGTNTRTVLTWTTGALTTAQTNLQWYLSAYISTNTIGSSGKVFAHGTFGIPLTAPTAGITFYADANTAASSTLDLTKTNTLAVNSLFGSTNAGNSVSQDTMIINLFN